MDLNHLDQYIQEVKNIAEKRGQSLAAVERLLKDIEETRRHPLNIVVIGEFSSGKSSLINSLVGKEFLPTHLPETTRTTFLVEIVPPGAEEFAELDGARYSLDKLSELNLKEKRVVKVYVASEALPPGTRLWDTPGLSSIYQIHEYITSEALAKADVILLVIPAKQGLTKSLLNFLGSSSHFASKVFVILSQADLLSPEARMEVLKNTLQRLKEFGIRRIVLASSKGDPGLGELKQTLLQEILGRAQELKAETLKNRLKTVTTHVYHALSEMLSSLNLDVGELNSKIEKYKAEREQILRKMRDRTIQLKNELREIFNDFIRGVEENLYQLSRDKNILNQIIESRSGHPFTQRALGIWHQEQKKLQKRVFAVLENYRLDLGYIDVEFSFPWWTDWLDVLILTLIAVLSKFLEGFGNLIEVIIAKPLWDKVKAPLLRNSISSSLATAVRKSLSQVKRDLKKSLGNLEQEVQNRIEKEIEPQLRDIEKMLESLRNKKKQKIFDYEQEKQGLLNDLERIKKIKDVLEV